MSEILYWGKYDEFDFGFIRFENNKVNVCFWFVC